MKPKTTNLSSFSTQFSRGNYVHIAAQTPRAFSWCRPEALPPPMNNSPLSLPSALGTPLSLSVPMNLATLNTTYECNVF